MQGVSANEPSAVRRPGGYTAASPISSA